MFNHLDELNVFWSSRVTQHNRLSLKASCISSVDGVDYLHYCYQRWLICMEAILLGRQVTGKFYSREQSWFRKSIQNIPYHVKHTERPIHRRRLWIALILADELHPSCLPSVTGTPPVLCNHWTCASTPNTTFIISDGVLSGPGAFLFHMVAAASTCFYSENTETFGTNLIIPSSLLLRCHGKKAFGSFGC